METRWRYRPEILIELERFGLRPTPAHHPETVYAALKRLYSFEIRGLNGCRRAAEASDAPVTLETYRRQVKALKRRYAVLSEPPWRWAVAIEPSEQGG